MRGDLAPNEALRLRAFLREPGAEVAVLGVLHREAVAHARAFDLGEPVEDAQRPRLAAEQLGEVRLAQPRRDTVADLDADLGGSPSRGVGVAR